MARAVIVKLGGSVITDKSKPFSYRSDVVSALAEEIASSDEKVLVVHGGGSFGHTVAKEQGISSDEAAANAAAVSKTRGAMYDLDSLLCKTMTENKLFPYSFSPFDVIAKAGRALVSQWLRGLLKSGLTPVTFGDVTPTPAGFRVLSGDLMVLELAKILEPERCIFALDADGVYEEGTRVIIPELSPSKIRKMHVSKGEDVTGGMKLKLEVAAKIATLGISVCLVSGYRRNEFAKALKGLEFYGTVIRS
ncbi:MAG: isopentenyl phosphate kinase [Nitrososphaerales archaeon]